jgi:DNA-binding NarL/FixJ family response regulator
MLIEERSPTHTRTAAPENQVSGDASDAVQALTILLLALLSATARPSAPSRSSWTGAQAETALLSWNENHVRLTARELDVLRLVARGLTNAEIGMRLYISRRTVEQHLCSLYNKLGVSTRTAATHFAFQHHLC